MAGPASIEPTPIDIGAVAKPDFAALPDAGRMFAARAARFAELAPGHPLEAYLRFLAELSEAQHAVQDDLPAPEGPSADALERAFEFGMPPLDRSRFDIGDVAHLTFERLLERARAIAMPEPAAAARDRLIAAGREGREALMTDALETSAGFETLAEHVFASAALQVHFARLAGSLDAARLASVGVGACPCCGGPPVSSLVVSWSKAHGSRYVACGLCGTLWNHVRIKCVACDSTEKIAYQALSADGETLTGETALEARRDEAPIKAETCDTCGLYVKILHQHLQPSLDPVADDVASLGLDLKVREAGWARAAFNPYLLGY
ncbi:formate dehydrogenase accessory protein FdhE [Methylopila henanensis]|uniref:Protein FdhE homolog n=1 Tax=Methylopila henanensis TaxID=873516 RepID=A0ABW4KF65_9HYPH